MHDLWCDVNRTKSVTKQSDSAMLTEKSASKSVSLCICYSGGMAATLGFEVLEMITPSAHPPKPRRGKKRILLALGWYDYRLHRGIAKYAEEQGWHLCPDSTREKVIPWG